MRARARHAAFLLLLCVCCLSPRTIKGQKEPSKEGRPTEGARQDRTIQSDRDLEPIREREAAATGERETAAPNHEPQQGRKTHGELEVFRQPDGLVFISHEPLAFRGDDSSVSVGYPFGEATLPVDVSLGKDANENDVYLRLFVPDSNPEINIDEIKDSLESIGGSALSDHYLTEQCVGDRTCTKRCPDGKGGDFCCQWTCQK